jgi:hypothetical protein
MTLYSTAQVKGSILLLTAGDSAPEAADTLAIQAHVLGV